MVQNIVQTIQEVVHMFISDEKSEKWKTQVMRYVFTQIISK